MPEDNGKTKIRVIPVAYDDGFDENNTLLTKPFMGSIGGEKVRIEIALPRPLISSGLNVAEEQARLYYGSNASIQTLIDRGIVNGIATAIPWQKDVDLITSEDDIDRVHGHMMNLIADYKLDEPRATVAKATIKKVKAELSATETVNKQLASQLGMSEEDVQNMISKAIASQTA